MSKQCGCGASYDAAAWRALAFVGWQEFSREGELPEVRLELRNCPCGSTLALREGAFTSNREAA